MDVDQKNEERMLIGIDTDVENENEEPPAPAGSWSIFFDLMWLIFGGGLIMLLLWLIFGLIGTILLIPSSHSTKLLAITPSLLSPTTKYIDYKTVNPGFWTKISLIFWIIPFGFVLSLMHFILGLISLPLLFCGIKWSQYHFKYLSAVFNPFPRIIIDTNIHRFNYYTKSYDVIKYSNNLSNKVVIITGCNTGIGKETAKQLYAAGCIVVMGCRNQSKADQARDDILQEIKGGNEANIFNIRLDLGDLKTIDEFVHAFNQNKIINGKLDYLIANAGVFGFPEYGTTKDKIERHFGINHIGHFYLTNKLLPVLKKNKTRIISVSSFFHEALCGSSDMISFVYANPSNMGPSPDTIPYDPFRYCGISKLCNVLFTRHLNRLYNKDGIVALCLHPGLTMSTDGGRNMKPSCAAIKTMIFNLSFLSEIMKQKTLSEGAATTLRCVTISNKEIFGAKKLDDTTNMALYFADCMIANHKINKEFMNGENSAIDQALWDYSCKIIGSLDYLALNE